MFGHSINAVGVPKGQYMLIIALYAVSILGIFSAFLFNLVAIVIAIIMLRDDDAYNINKYYKYAIWKNVIIAVLSALGPMFLIIKIPFFIISLSQGFSEDLIASLFVGGIISLVINVVLGIAIFIVKLLLLLKLISFMDANHIEN